MSTFIVGGLIALILFWSFKRTRHSIKNNQCPGCSGGCSAEEKNRCKPQVPLE